MNNSFLNIILLLFLTQNVFGQKKQLTDSSYKEWTEVGDGLISTDGKFLSYIIKNKPLKSFTRVLISSDKSWRKDLIGHEALSFSNNSKFAFYLNEDTLCQLELGSDKVIKSANCDSYQLVTDDKSEWLVYHENLKSRQLFIKDISGYKLQKFSNVSEVIPIGSNGNLLLRSAFEGKNILQWLKLRTGEIKTIYSGNMPTDLIFDRSGSQMAFKTIELNNTNTLWYFNLHMDNCRKICDDKTYAMLRNHTIGTERVWKFAYDNQHLYFTQDTIAKNLAFQDNLEVSDYRDAYLIGVYKSLRNTLQSGKNLSIVNIRTGKIIQLLKGTESVETDPSQSEGVFVFSKRVPINPHFRNGTRSKKNFYIYMSKTGVIYPLKLYAGLNFEYSVSPNGDYVAYKTHIDAPIECFNTKLGKSLVIGFVGTNTKNIPDPLFKTSKKLLLWDDSGQYLLVQDKFDLWLLDVKPGLKAVNITQGKGLSQRTIYYPIKNISKPGVSIKEEIYLAGFNIDTKRSSVNLASFNKRSFKKLIELNTSLSDPYNDISESRMRMAKGANCFLLLFSTSETSANYYYTAGFKKLIAVSDEFPENKYNWIKSELIAYKDSNNNSYQAILYKPANFDASKKYPVVFKYYLHNSNSYFDYLSPAPVGSDINIPLIVTSGYLVVCPDITMVSGSFAPEAALKCVNAAADYLTSKSYTDPLRFGIVGHSFGGFETNYIITHSDRFKAAISGAGISNLVQYVNDINKQRGSGNEGYVEGTFGYPVSMDSISTYYLNDSPILFAKQVKTPLLLVHNGLDLTVDVSQSVQFFNQLRALRKPVWWLNYADEPHMILNETNRLDYQRRANEFFDYYLMHRSIPKWMNSPIKYE